MKRILTLGGVVRDIFIEYESTHMLHLQGTQDQQSFILLEEGTKIEVKNITYHVGGGAANAAVSFSRLGFEVGAFFKIGDDQEGIFVLEGLAKEDVSTKHSIIKKGAKTGASFIIPCPSGNKAILVYRGANVTLQEKELPFKSIAHCDLMYITSLSQQASLLLLPITNHAKQHNKPVAVNPGTSQFKYGAETLCQSLKNIDILILNSDEAQEFMLTLTQTEEPLQKKVMQPKSITKNRKLPQLLQTPYTYKNIHFNVTHYFKEILSRGPKIVVVTNGAEGVYVAHEDSIYFYPSIASKVVSTVGAGDAFASCFVASICSGKTIQQSLVAGSINSHSVIEHIGTQTGLVSKEKLDQLLKKTNLNLVQKFDL